MSVVTPGYHLTLAERLQSEGLFSRNDAELFDRATEAYIACHCTRHSSRTAVRDVRIVEEFVGYSLKAPWHWTGEDLAQWYEHVAITKTLSVQRIYKSAITRFMNFIATYEDIKREIIYIYALSVVGSLSECRYSQI